MEPNNVDCTVDTQMSWYISFQATSFERETPNLEKVCEDQKQKQCNLLTAMHIRSRHSSAPNPLFESNWSDYLISIANDYLPEFYLLTRLLFNCNWGPKGLILGVSQNANTWLYCFGMLNVTLKWADIRDVSQVICWLIINLFTILGRSVLYIEINYETCVLYKWFIRCCSHRFLQSCNRWCALLPFQLFRLLSCKWDGYMKLIRNVISKNMQWERIIKWELFLFWSTVLLGIFTNVTDCCLILK